MQTETSSSSAAASLPVSEPFSASDASLPETSFARLLATMAAPHRSEAPWNDDRLADDVASISYERALRAHARVRSASSAAGRESEALPGSGETASRPEPVAGAPLKKASITIRLSEPECAQLRQRAAEAGLSVSAYLRSCTLEVESLRAQVKTTLAELRNSAPKPRELQMKAESSAGIRDLLVRVWRWLLLLGHRRHGSLPLNPANPFAPVRY